MKQVLYLISALIFLSLGCGQPESGLTENDSLTPEVSENETIVNSDAHDTLSYYEKNFREIETSELIGRKPLNEYLLDRKIPIALRSLFNGDGSALNDSEDNLALIDSLFSKDDKRHPFYFVLVTRVFWWADGAFAEPLYMAVKDYIQGQPYQFSYYFLNEKVLTEADLFNWADAVAMEIGISDEGNEKAAIDNVEKIMKINCKDCSAEQLELINRFIVKLREIGGY